MPRWKAAIRPGSWTVPWSSAVPGRQDGRRAAAGTRCSWLRRLGSCGRQRAHSRRRGRQYDRAGVGRAVGGPSAGTASGGVRLGQLRVGHVDFRGVAPGARTSRRRAGAASACGPRNGERGLGRDRGCAVAVAVRRHVERWSGGRAADWPRCGGRGPGCGPGLRSWRRWPCRSGPSARRSTKPSGVSPVVLACRVGVRGSGARRVRRADSPPADSSPSSPCGTTSTACTPP